MSRLGRYEAALFALVVAAFGLRLQGAIGQSIWLDEDFTRRVVDAPLKDMLRAISATESNPSLFYGLDWAATQVLGAGARTVRVVPLLAGVASVPVAFLLGRRLRGEAAGLILAALFAIHPLAVWYGVEARSYGLFLLLSLTTLLCFVRLLQQPDDLGVALWTVAAGSMTITHYFGAFIAAAELAVLFAMRPALRRHLVAAAATLALLGLATAPLWALQDSGRTLFIRSFPLGERLAGWARQAGGGMSTPTWLRVEPVAIGALAAIAGALYPAWSRGRARDATGAVAIAGALAAALTLLFANDYVLGRNMIGLWPFAGALVAVGLVVLPRVAGAAAGLLIAVPAVIATGAVVADETLQRPDFERLARAVAPQSRGRVVVLSGSYSALPLGYYLQSPAQPAGAQVRALEVVAVGADLHGRRRSCESGALCNMGSARPLAAPAAGLKLVQRRRAGAWQIAVYRAPRPTTLTSARAAALFDKPRDPQLFVYGPAP